MNVLLVSQYFHPEPFLVNDLVRGLIERGHQVTVLTGMPNYPEGRRYPGYGWFRPARETFAGASVLRVPIVTRGRGQGMRLIINYASFVLSASLLGWLRARGRHDAVLVFEPSPITVGLPALWLARRWRAPVLLWVQDLWPDTLAAVGQGRLVRAIGSGIARFVHNRCAALLTQSMAFEQPLRAQGVAAQRIVYLPNWAEAHHLEAAPARAEGDPLARWKGFRIVFAGTLGTAQSFETILDAAAQLGVNAGVQWLILGDGSMRGWIETQIATRDLGECVFLLGRQPESSMPAYFAAADALLVSLRPAPVFAMTVPRKVQSYLAAGRPIVAALDGAGAQVIEQAAAGRCVPAGDAAALAAAVRELSRCSPQQRAQMGERARAYYLANFDRAVLLDRLEQRLNQTVSEYDASDGSRR